MSEEDVLDSTLSRINARAWGIATGLILGLGLFVATNILVLRGGPDMGTHLGRLGQVLPGYSVSFIGSLVGMIYGFVIGYGLGRLIGPRRPLARDADSRDNVHVRLKGRTWGLTLGVAGGLTLFAVTNLLEVKGGKHPGEFLSNLHIYLPGYSVDFAGSVVGFAWVLLIGVAIGEGIAWIYNRAVARAES